MNLYFVYFFFKGAIELEQDNLALGLFTITFLFIWAVVNVILYVIYRVMKRSASRLCPACASKVKTGITLCSNCGFDFMKFAMGVNEEKESNKTEANSENLDASQKIKGEDKASKPINLTYRIAFAAILFISAAGFVIEKVNGDSGKEANNAYFCATNPLIPAFSEECEPLGTSQNNLNESWKPSNFIIWDENPNVAFRWLKSNEYKCEYGDACWGLMTISKSGCPSNLYVELSILDKNDVQIGYTNDSLSSTLPLQKSKMVFGTYQESADTARISKISCY